MSAYQKSQMRNRLLSLIPEQEFQIVAAALVPIELGKGFVIVKPDEPIDYVYFPSTGIGSVVTVSPEGHKAEAGMFGRDGFSPTPAGVGGTISIHEVLMQVEGEGLRIKQEELTGFCPSVRSSQTFWRGTSRPSDHRFPSPLCPTPCTASMSASPAGC